MDTQNKKKLYLQLIVQFLIFALSCFVSIGNIFLMLGLLIDGFSKFIILLEILLIIVTSFSACIVFLYPFVAVSSYKLINGEQLSDLNKTGLKIFSWLFVPVFLEILIVIFSYFYIR